MQDFNIEDFNYDLPEDRIAKFPLERRDQSKLLIWKKGQIAHHRFYEVPRLLPQDAVLVFNNTKVISARLMFMKTSGASIEIFLLHPESPTRDIHQAMMLKEEVVWQCLIGNKKRWKGGMLQKAIGNSTLTAHIEDREKNLVRFEWTGGDSFAEIINRSGQTPLPPYLKRAPVKEDALRYQTVYSRHDGAVAAPTAGLHFTDQILEQISRKHISMEYLTLHVSAGTFKPVEATDYRQHDMHCEQIVVNRGSIENLHSNHKNIIAVGTTSLRILESLYWFGALLQTKKDAIFNVGKDLPYQLRSDISFGGALENVLHYCDRNNLSELRGETEIYIYPGYQIKSASGLFTNFHLPKSTLLLLISSFVDEQWRRIYEEALLNDYRFLSYGDSSLLLR